MDSQPRRKRGKRDLILDAAIQEFRTLGFDNTSMDRIAEVANVSKRTVYNHFPSKEVLFEAIVNRLVERCEGMQHFDFELERPLDAQLLEIGKRYGELVSSDDFRNLARVILPRFLQNPELAQRLMGEKNLLEQAIISWIETAVNSQRLQPCEPSMAATQFVGLISNFLFWPQVLSSAPTPSEEETQAVIQSAVAMFLGHYSND